MRAVPSEADPNIEHHKAENTFTLELLLEEPVEHSPAVVAKGGRHELVRPEPVRHVHLEPLAKVLEAKFITN